MMIEARGLGKRYGATAAVDDLKEDYQRFLTQA